MISDTLSEFEGCTLLARLFRRRGYAIERNVMFREYGVEFHIDGWDRKARVGFEFLTSEDDDHDDLTLEEYNTLSDAQHRGELSLFIIDEVEPISAADLLATANEFLDEVEAGRRQKPASKRVSKKVARKKAAKKAAKRPSAKKAARKVTTRKSLKKKATTKKAAAKKATKKMAKKAAKRPVKKVAKKKAVKKKTRR